MIKNMNKMIAKIVFLISNFVACFIPGGARRHKCRGQINMFLLRPFICRFIKKNYGEKIKSIAFVRQHTLNRMVCVVNDYIYVKVFRNVSVKNLKNYGFLLRYIRPLVDVQIPNVIVDDIMPMYGCVRIPGRPVISFDKQYVFKNESKILDQVSNLIAQLQKIDVQQIPGYERFLDSMQSRTPELDTDNKKFVLAHFDLNEMNILFDDDLNICSVIDWDTLSVATNPDTDWRIFMKYWTRFKLR